MADCWSRRRPAAACFPAGTIHAYHVLDNKLVDIMFNNKLVNILYVLYDKMVDILCNK